MPNSKWLSAPGQPERYFTLAQAQPDHPQGVPVVIENAGPYPSLDAALADWPGFHEATDAEYEAYENYWRDKED